MPISKTLAVLTVAITIMAAPGVPAAVADETIVAKVNDAPITKLDVQLATAEIGGDLGSLDPQIKRRVVVEYLIENEIMAAAATQAGLGANSKSNARGRYWNRRGLRESYFYNHITGTVTAADARKYYDQNIASKPPEKQVKASHILLKSKEKAIEIFEKLAHGGDFAEMARKHSTDPGTQLAGGQLGFLGRGRMLPQFEAAAFKLKVGEISEPVQTRFGWHLIRVDGERTTKIPAFAEIQEQILLSLIHKKAKQIAADLRRTAQVEYIDPELKKAVEASQQNSPAR